MKQKLLLACLVLALPIAARADTDTRAGLERLTSADRASCETRQAHSRPAYRTIILHRCVANFIAKYERGLR